MRSAAAALVAAAGLAAVAVHATPSASGTFPNKPVRLIVPFVAGIGTDTVSRTVAVKLTERWGHPVVVDNRPGAAGAIGVETMLNAPPDGYTICLISASHSVALRPIRSSVSISRKTSRASRR